MVRRHARWIGVEASCDGGIVGSRDLKIVARGLRQNVVEGLGKRFEQEPGKISFSEVVLSQQTLATTYTGYLTVLAAAWQAVADLSRLAQSEEQIGGTDSWPEPVTPVRRKS